MCRIKSLRPHPDIVQPLKCGRLGGDVLPEFEQRPLAHASVQQGEQAHDLIVALQTLLHGPGVEFVKRGVKIPLVQPLHHGIGT